MALNGIRGAGHNVAALRSAYAVTPVNPRKPSALQSPPPESSKASSVTISSSAELLGKLRQLHDAKPKQFKALMQEMADEVRAHPGAASGGSRVSPELAERFAKAAAEGNITPLVPAIEPSAIRQRANYLQTPDVMIQPNESVRELFRGFVEKVNAVLPSAGGGKSTPTPR